MTQASLTYIDGLLEKILLTVDTVERSSFAFFAHHFFKRFSFETLEAFSEETWKKLLFQAWVFYKTCSPHQRVKVSCVLEDLQTSQGLFQGTSLLIFNPNVPFLVDSLQHALQREHLGVSLLCHPVFVTKRDHQGHLLNLAPAKASLPDAAEESFIFCLLHEALTPSETLEVTAKIEQLFERVTCVVKDWPDMRACARELARALPVQKEGLVGEIGSFFQWIDGGHFTFLGYSRHIMNSQGEISLDPQAISLGLLRNAPQDWPSLLFDGIQQTSKMRHLLNSAEPRLLITKTSQKSPILRPEFMDAIGFKILDDAGRVIGLHHFLGFFTARAYTQSARDIPLVRLKVREVLEKSGLDASWHDGKRLIHILETLPRDELFQSTAEDLLSLGTLGLEFQMSGPVRLFVRVDMFERYISCFIYVPRDHYRAGLRYQMGEFLASFFEGALVTSHVHLESLPFAWIHCLIHLPKPFSKDISLPLLEQQLTALSVTWEDRLKTVWIRVMGEKKGYALFRQSRLAFPKSYEEYCTPEEAVQDFEEIKIAFEKKHLRLFLKLLPGEEKVVSLKIYSPTTSIPLSDMIPALENMGFKVLTEIPFKIQIIPGEQEGWIHIIKAQIGHVELTEQTAELLADTFRKVWLHETENDGFNRLVLTAGLTWRECFVFRAYTKYLKQIQVSYSQSYVEEVLNNHHTVLKGLLRLFHYRFDPLFAHRRQELQAQELQTLQVLLSHITHPNEERVLQYFLNLILATLRTNFYQKNADGSSKPYVSFKFDCHAIDHLPRPLPLYEIFVYSSRMEGLHLRGGKVARGGIRWSDRLEDYRTEVLDLMKTQMVKNSVTVPVGSKGAFVVKTSGLDAASQNQEGISCYEIFIRGLLDLTDNRVEREIVPPPDIVPWDEPDPYLVVAADKGTAARSNDANALAEKYHFWLRDAFASGGIHGYNHKKMAITSRGAWKSVEHHFKEIGLDPQTTPFTVVGIGDMSGDVFGNGMLLSRHIKLVAAFDHRHIFLDPDPDIVKSYQERERLFHLPLSSWEDYDRKALSPGGGIFSRELRSIVLSPQIREWLGVREETMTPDALIRVLLRASVDLLWLGGIGTFVKASTENDAQVGDRANDSVRVQGNELKARVVVEGGNLGFTQRGRIEYALTGGRINTDALDNSAGVDCSDHEVNLKILFEGLIQRQEMTLEDRNKLLESMTDDVASLVLMDNYWQNQAVALAYSKGVQLLEEHGRLMRTLESKGILDRALEALPTDDVLQQRKALKLGLTRPELCVLLAYSKIVLYHQLVASDLLADPLIERVLYKYFPRVVTEKFAQACANHPLKREIVATLVTNIIVNTLGPSFVNEVCELTGALPPQVVRAIWVTRKVLKLGELEDAYLHLTNPLLQQQALWFMDSVMKRLVIWFLRQENMDAPIADIVARYRAGFDELRLNILEFLPKNYLEPLTQSLALFFETEEARGIGQTLLIYDPLSFAPDMIQVSGSLKKPLVHVARLYYALGEFLGLRWVQRMSHELPLDTSWNQKAFREIREQMLLIQQQLALYILSSYPIKRFEEEGILQMWEKDRQLILSRYRGILAEVQKNPLTDLAPLVVLGRELERLYEKTAGMCTMTVSY